MWSFLTSLFSGTVLDGLKSIVTTVAGNKQERDQAAASDQAAVRQQYAAEFTGPEKRGWWNSLVDGINRLVRPLFTFGTLALFWWCYDDPIEFAAAMTSLQLVPEPLWVILGTIVVFWFGGKTLGDFKATAVPAKAVQAVTQQLAELREQGQPASSPEPSTAMMPAVAVKPAPGPAEAEHHPAPAPSHNPALEAWFASRTAGGA